MAFEGVHEDYVAPKKLPGPGELAALIRDGHSLYEIGRMFDASPSSVRQAVNGGGYSSTTGEARPVTVEPLGAWQMLKPQPWVEDALCAQTDPDAFFPEKGESSRDVKALCRECLVRAECLEYSLANGERFGIWGGLSERERRKLARHTDPDDAA